MIATPFLLSLALLAAAPADAWPVPKGWKHETFELPPGFAPEFPYKGGEDLRFMPGFSSPEAPDFWSYVFVWWVDEATAFDAAGVGPALVTYFRGLSAAVGGEKYTFDPALFRAELAAAPEAQPPRLTGRVFTYDPFKTGEPITLNVEITRRPCPATKQAAFVVLLSPQKTTHAVWTELRAAAKSLVCP